MATERQKEAKRLLKLIPGPFTKIDLSKYPEVTPKWMTRAFRNNRYTVMIDDNQNTTHGIAIKLMIQRHDDKPIPFH